MTPEDKEPCRYIFNSGQFPFLDFADFPIAEEAACYFNYGPNFLKGPLFVCDSGLGNFQSRKVNIEMRSIAIKTTNSTHITMIGQPDPPKVGYLGMFGFIGVPQ